jgi:hypothetical protein
MAGIKVTELPSIGTLEKTDITYVVDVSNDTSKQATIQDVVNAVDQVGLEDNDGFASISVTDSTGIKVKSNNGAFQGLYYNEDNSANYQSNSLITRADAPRIYNIPNTPCDEGLIPLAVGDIYIDANTDDFYYSFATTDCSNWRKLAQTNGGGYTANIVSILPAGQAVSFFGGNWNLAGNVVSCKTRAQLTMGGTAGHSYTFQISLPLVPSSTFGINTQIQGSVIPFGSTTLWHKVNHTSVIASNDPSSQPCAEIFVEVDNSMNGLCQFVFDFSYEMF